MKDNRGFTMIELIVVIVILGILAATALPRFVDVQTNARLAKAQGATGAIKSASALAHAAYLVNSSSVVTIENSTYTLVNGYPAATDIASLAGLAASDYSLGTASGGSIIISTDSGHTNCSVTYAQAASAGAVPTITLNASMSNC